MKGAFGPLFGRSWRPFLGSLALASLLVGCGDDESDPTAVTVDKLKYPGSLAILDLGNGKVQLSWSGSNNEEKFDGYNVYGMKGAATKDSLGVTEGVALKLLDDKGEVDTTSRDLLAKFNYDPATGLNSAGTAKNDDGEVKFSALPIHTKDADKRLLPTCKHQSGVCVPTTAANKSETASNSAYAVNGKITYDISGLSVGESYCFLVLASMDGGKTVSQTSSNVQCVVPKYLSEFTMTLPASSAANRQFDLRKYAEACATAGTCPNPETGTDYIKTNSGFATPQAETPVSIEIASGKQTLTPGKNSSVLDLGFYAAGFKDATLPAKAPKLELGATTNGTGDNVAPIINAGGYSIAGQSIPLEQGHVYILAVGAKDGTPTKFNYHWLYVEGTTTGASTAVKMLLSKNAE